MGVRGAEMGAQAANDINKTTAARAEMTKALIMFFT
jgi:hypothetical protein